MNTYSPPSAVYYETVRRPYFVIICTSIREGHQQYDKYSSKPNGLVDFMLQVVNHLTQGRKEILDRMCALDEQDVQQSSHRSRRYIAKDSSHLYEPIEYNGYGFSTNADKRQAFEVVALACKATEVPYQTIRKFNAFTG